MSKKIILVGYGNAGRVWHAPLARAAGFDIAAIVSTNPERIATAQRDWPSASIFPSLDDALASCDAPLVIVATSSATHVPLARQAVAAGRHVVIDKPFALDVTEADLLISEAAAQQVSAIGFQNRRWDADFLTLKKLVANNALGKVKRYAARFDRYSPTRRERWQDAAAPGSGALLDLGPHLLDQALQINGWPDWVQCTLLKQRAGALTDDGFEIVMAKGDCLISLGASVFAAAGPEIHGAPRFVVNGEKATWIKHGFDPQEALLKKGHAPDGEAWGQESLAAQGRLLDGTSGAMSLTPPGIGRWADFYERVAAHIVGLGAPPVAAAESRDLTLLLDEARRAAESGERRRLMGLAKSYR